VAFVRTFLQHHRYSWDSIGQLLLSWLIHYVALGLFMMVSGAAIMTHGRYFLDDEKQNIDVEQATVYISIVVLIAALFIFFVAHWIPGDWE
jgi:hypothetical protein